MNIVELRQRHAGLVQDAKVIIDLAEAENRDLTEEEQVEYDGYLAEADAVKVRIERAQKLEAELAKMSQPEDRTSKAPAFNKTRPGDNEERAMAHYIRTGDNSALGELRASNDTIANEGTAADGGNAVPTGHFGQIIARRDEQMLANALGIRRIAGVGLTVNVPVDAEDDGEFITKAEQADNYANTFDRDWPALGTVAMTLVKYTKKIALTDELLQDEDSSLLAFVSDFVGRGMAKTHNSLLMTEVLANGTAALTLDSATAIGAAEIPELMYTMPDGYQDGSAWIMRRATEGYLRGLTGDNFQFSPTPAAGGNSLFGAPVYNTAYAGEKAASGKSLVFLNPFFVALREAPQMSFLRDPYTTDGIVYLKYYFRVVYKVLQAEAVRYATHPTA
jgi:HK97 family phage major capsid protein